MLSIIKDLYSDKYVIQHMVSHIEILNLRRLGLIPVKSDAMPIDLAPQYLGPTGIHLPMGPLLSPFLVRMLPCQATRSTSVL